MRSIGLAVLVAGSLLLPGACATTTSVQSVQAPELHVHAQPMGPHGLEPADAETLFKRGLDFLEGGAWDDAALYFERLIREFPDDNHVILAHYNRGVAYIHLERGDEAVAAFDKYIAM